jgi:rsbT co-antagonist protein RsbR
MVAPPTMDALSEFFESFPGLAFAADEHGKLLRVSLGLVQRFGARVASGTSLRDWVAPVDRERVDEFLRELAGSEESVACTVRVADSERTPTIRCVARRSTGGLILAHVELVFDTDQARIEHTLFRTIMETLDIALWAIEPSGKFVFHDGKALSTVGLEPGQFLGLDMFELYPPEGAAPARAALAGTAKDQVSEVHGLHWHTWYVPLKNQRGEVDYCAGLTLDITGSVRTKQELEQQIETIRAQQRAIHELSAPVLEIWEGVLAVPLIGMMDTERTNDIIARLLDRAHHSHTRFAILDLTGVEILDTSIANHLLRLLGTLRLLGVEGMVSGISPSISLTMVGLGIELDAIRSHRSLREALRHCMVALGHAD